MSQVVLKYSAGLEIPLKSLFLSVSNFSVVADNVSATMCPRLPHVSSFALMPHSCIAGGCFNTRKDGVSPHKCPEDAHFAKLWKNAVKNTHCDVFNPLIS